MICADSSVWIEALRDFGGETARHLTLLLEEDAVLLPVPVRIELLSGASRRDIAALSGALAGVPGLIPGPATWERVEGWVGKAVGAGYRFGLVDLLIAALAAERDVPVWSLDADFVQMEKLGFVVRYAAP